LKVSERMKIKYILLVGCVMVLSTSCGKKWPLLRRKTSEPIPIERGRDVLVKPGEVYSIRGVLVASEVFWGGPTAPKRFLIRDPETGVIRAYVQSASGAVELDRYENQNVQVVGQVRVDEISGLVVEVRKIISLSERALPETTEVPSGQDVFLE